MRIYFRLLQPATFHSTIFFSVLEKLTPTLIIFLSSILKRPHTTASTISLSPNRSVLTPDVLPLMKLKLSI